MFRCAKCGALNRVPASRPSGEPSCGRCHLALDVRGAPQEVSGEELYLTVANSQVPVLLDVWAPWCGPCRMMAPVLDAVAKERAGQVLVLKLNSDEHQDASARFGIRGIPTLILFRNGCEVTRQSGMMSKPMLDGWLTAQLVGSPAAQL